MKMNLVAVLVCMMAVGGLSTVSRAGDPQILQIEGSTTVGPIGDAFAEAFMKMHPELAITVKKTGSGDGAA
ncbi:MAG: hypothetical protein JW860_03105, partial [Sedimentisphaerales bacterium]|nr:hypothetical protein [Sedimentisphaerales bacterium]